MTPLLEPSLRPSCFTFSANMPHATAAHTSPTRLLAATKIKSQLLTYVHKAPQEPAPASSLSPSPSRPPFVIVSNHANFSPTLPNTLNVSLSGLCVALPSAWKARTILVKRVLSPTSHLSTFSILSFS